MCGIAGILRIHDPKDGPPPHPLEAIPESWLDVLDDSIMHRGPDGQGRFRDRAIREDGTVVDVAFVHRRLSIIDHAGGHQPMVHDGERLRPDLTYARGETPKLAHELCPQGERPDLVAVVFNGCIYNHRELRRELEAQGHRFETDHSDTEVLVHGWRAWREMLPGSLEGMYAWGVWSRAAGSLRLARDWVGEKPLLVARPRIGDARPCLAFCSCLSGVAGWLSNSGLDPTAVERESLREDLARYDAGWELEYTATMDGRVMSRHRVSRAALARRLDRIPRSAVAPYAYGLRNGWIRRGWADASPIRYTHQHEKGTVNGEPPLDNLRTWPAWRGTCEPVALDAERADSLIRTAVVSRLEADVPIGCFLSGGIDSALISHYASEHMRARGTRLVTLTVRMPDHRYDESMLAAETARRIGTDHHTVECNPGPADDLVRLIHGLGMPFGDSSLLPTYWVSVAAREHVMVALSGDGGDELFAGYERYRIAALPRPAWHALGYLPVSLAPRRNPKGLGERIARLAEIARWSEATDLFASQDHQRLLLGRAERAPRPPCRPRLDKMLSNDRAGYLPEDLLRKMDTASMAVPIEVRAPLLDRSLLACAYRTPARILMPRGQRKGLLKQVARRYLPDHIVDRPKRGFAIPIGEWFRTDYGGLRQLLYDHLESADPFPGLAEAGVEINMAFVRRMLREHDAAGEKSLNPWHGRDHSQRLYMLLVLSIWAKWLSRVRCDPIA